MIINPGIYGNLQNIDALVKGECKGFIVIPSEDDIRLDFTTEIKPNIKGTTRVKEVKKDSELIGYFVDQIFVHKAVLELEGVTFASLDQDISTKSVYCSCLGDQPMPHPLHYSLEKKPGCIPVEVYDEQSLLQLVANHYKYSIKVDIKAGVSIETSKYMRLSDDQAIKTLMKPSFDSMIARFCGSSFDRIADYAYLIYFIMDRLQDQIFSAEEKVALQPLLDQFTSKVDKLERIVDRDLAIGNMIAKRMQDFIG